MTDDLVFQRLEEFALVTIMARKGVDRGAIGDALGLTLPDGPTMASGEEMTLLGVGPGSWLALAPTEDSRFARRVQERLRGIASVSDQSSGYAIFGIGGARAGELLQHGLAIDLHPDAFVHGSVAVSVIAHVGVIVWRADEGFRLAVFRSFADHMAHWIDITAAAMEAAGGDVRIP